MGLLAETPVFVDTSLGTRFALSVPGGITAGDLKCKLKCEHHSCFPTLGKIVVHSLMVKQKSFFYHIPDSMLLKVAFQGFPGPWFLRVDASRLTDIPMQQTTVLSSINHFRGQDSPCEGETVKRNFCKLAASSNFDCCKLGDQVLCTKANMNRKNEGSISNMIDISNTSKARDFTTSTFTVTDMRNQACKIARDCSTCNEGKVDVLSLSLPSQKSVSKRRKLGHGIQGNVVGKEAVFTKKTCKSEHGSGLDSGKEKEVTNANTMMDEVPNAVQKEKTWLSEQPSEKEQRENSLSEKISVTGLISRYFSNIDEVTSCSILNKIVRDVEDVTLQPNNMLNIQEIQLNEATGFSTKDVHCSADNKSSNESESDCNTACSFNIITPEKKQFCPVSNRTRTIDKNKSTASDGKKRPKATVSSESCGNKSMRSSSQVNRRSINSTLQSTLRVSSLPYSSYKCKSNFSSKKDKYEVGKHLVLAANSIYSSVTAKKKPKSRCISRSGNMSAPDSIVIVKGFSFEINDSDG